MSLIPRYVPELQALAARKLAEFCRTLTPPERVKWLRALPSNARELVECFPTNFIVWCGHEQLLWTKIMRFYLNDSARSQRNIIGGYQKDCERGITRRKVLWRKCCNIYCNNNALQKIISSPDDMYWRMCSECEKFRIEHHILMKLKLEIENFEFS